MSSQDLSKYEYDLGGYLREEEPEFAKRANYWQTAIGLQAVDGLKVSDYLLDTANRHIKGELSIEDVQSRISQYYENRAVQTDEEADAEEADIVSSRIAMLLGSNGFSFSPATWKSIHGKLFDGLLQHAGAYRKYNITKREWALNGETVMYSDWETIPATVDYDFAREKEFSYAGLTKQQVAEHLATFSSGIWQVHPFEEGNTRSTAVFMIKYMNLLGFKVDNEPFAKNSWFFRNALVRANYNNFDQGITASKDFLVQFYENLLGLSDHKLKNRYLHVDWKE